MEIEALLENYHAEAANNARDIVAVKSEVSKLIDKVTAMAVGSATGVKPAQDTGPYAEAFNNYFRKGEAAAGGAVALRDLEIKAGLSVGADPDGGFSALPTHVEKIDKVLRDQSPMRGVSRVVTISGTALVELVDASDVGSGWLGESDARPETSSPQLIERKIPVNEIYAQPKATQSLLDDSFIDIGAWLAEKCGDRFGRDEGSAFVTGDGVNKPRGFLSVPATTEVDFTRAWGKLQYIASGGASSFAASNPGDALVDMFYTLRAPYRQNAVWMGSSDTARQVRKFKDSTGQYLWQPSLIAGQPDTFLGRPWVTNEFMPAVGSNSFPIAFGDFSKGYIIVDRMGVRVLRDNLTQKPFVLFYTTKRVGGDIADTNAIKILKIATS